MSCCVLISEKIEGFKNEFIEMKEVFRAST